MDRWDDYRGNQGSVGQIRIIFLLIKSVKGFSGKHNAPMLHIVNLLNLLYEDGHQLSSSRIAPMPEYYLLQIKCMFFLQIISSVDM